MPYQSSSSVRDQTCVAPQCCTETVHYGFKLRVAWYSGHSSSDAAECQCQPLIARGMLCVWRFA
eukprot:320001-Pyramimonas_sp.AAC.1